MKSYFKNLTKIKKALLILITSFIFLLSSLAAYYAFGREKEINNNENEVPKDNIIVKDNYSYDNGNLLLLDENDQKIGNYECITKDVNKCYVAYELMDDSFDEPQNEYEDNTLIEIRSKIYFNRFAFIYDNDKTILYDFINKETIGEYQVKSFYNKYINSLENNYVILKNNENKYGVVDLDNDKLITIIPFNYDYLGVIKKNVKEKDNKLVYKNKNNWGIINFKNNILFTSKEQITDYNDNYVKTKVSNNYNLYKYDKSKVLNNFSYIDTLNELIVTIKDNKNIMVYDLELTPLYSEQINIKNYNYVEINTYNSNKEFINTLKSYDVNLINDMLYVDILNQEDKDEYTFSILEGKISYKYDYYSYSNGKLTFFKDIEKSEIIGTYSCVNHNNLVNSSTLFSNCYLANDLTDSTKNYTTPIYNDRFVFIYDAPTLVNDSTIKYYLYDLKTNKLLGKYLSVYAYASSSSNKNGVYHEDALPKYVMAVNSSNKYGVLKIDTEEISKVVSFLYDDIKKQDKYLLGKTSNKWALLDYSGNMILDNTYQLYELYSEYIVAIDSDNKLYIFDYEKNSKINEPVVLDNINDEFTLSLEGNYIIISVNSNIYKYDLTTGDKIGE